MATACGGISLNVQTEFAVGRLLAFDVAQDVLDSEIHKRSSCVVAGDTGSSCEVLESPCPRPPRSVSTMMFADQTSRTRRHAGFCTLALSLCFHESGSLHEFAQNMRNHYCLDYRRTAVSCRVAKRSVERATERRTPVQCVAGPQGVFIFFSSRRTNHRPFTPFSPEKSFNVGLLPPSDKSPASRRSSSLREDHAPTHLSVRGSARIIERNSSAIQDVSIVRRRSGAYERRPTSHRDSQQRHKYAEQRDEKFIGVTW